MVEHILNEDAVSRCRIVYENVGDSSDELAVLNYGLPLTSVVKYGQHFFTVIVKINASNFCFVSHQKIDPSADMLALEINTVCFIINCFESRIKLGRSVGGLCY